MTIHDAGRLLERLIAQHATRFTFFTGIGSVSAELYGPYSNHPWIIVKGTGGEQLFKENDGGCLVWKSPHGVSGATEVKFDNRTEAIEMAMDIAEGRQAVGE